MAGPKGPVLDTGLDEDLLAEIGRDEAVSFDDFNSAASEPDANTYTIDLTEFPEADAPVNIQPVSASTFTTTGASLSTTPVQIVVRLDESDPLITNPLTHADRIMQGRIDAGLAGSYGGIAGLEQAKFDKDEKAKREEDKLRTVLDILDQIAAIDAQIYDMQQILDKLEEKKQLQARLEENAKALSAAEDHKESLEEDQAQNDQKLKVAEKKIDDLISDSENAGAMAITAGGEKGIVCRGKDGKCVMATKSGIKELTPEQQAEIDRREKNGEKVASPEELEKFEKAQKELKELLERREEIQENLVAADNQIASLKREKFDIENDIKSVDKQLDDLKTKYGLHGLTDQLQQQKLALQDKLGLNGQSISVLSDYQAQMTAASASLGQIAAVSPAEGGARVSAEDVSRVTAQIGDIRTQLDTLTANQKATTTSLETYGTQINQIDEDIAARTLAAIKIYNDDMTVYRQMQASLADARAQQTTMQTQRDALTSSKSALAEISKISGEVHDAIGEFDGTRKDYIESAYGGAIAFHWMNAKSLVGGAQPPLVKTDAGDVVYKDEKGLFTLKLDEKGELFKDESGQPVRQDITNPLEIAKLEHQAWVGSPPKLFGNERPTSVLNALGDLGNYLTRKDDKDMSAMRVQDSVAAIDTQIKSIDGQIAAISTEIEQTNANLVAIETQMDGLEKRINESQCAIYDNEREVIAAIEAGWLKDEDIVKIRDNSEDYFKQDIDRAIEYRDKVNAESKTVIASTSIAETSTTVEAPPAPAPDVGQMLADENKAKIVAAIIEKGGMTEDELKLVAAQHGITDPVHFETLKRELAAQQDIKPQYSAAGVLAFSVKDSEAPTNVFPFTPDQQTALLVAQASRAAALNGPQQIIAPAPMAMT